MIASQRQWAAHVVPLRQQIMGDNDAAYQHFFPSPAAIAQR
ncbi:MAG: hypothetical protein ACHQ4J_10865 [Candidatus Binatia bacterium]